MTGLLCLNDFMKCGQCVSRITIRCALTIDGIVKHFAQLRWRRWVADCPLCAITATAAPRSTSCDAVEWTARGRRRPQ